MTNLFDAFRSQSLNYDHLTGLAQQKNNPNRFGAALTGLVMAASLAMPGAAVAEPTTQADGIAVIQLQNAAYVSGAYDAMHQKGWVLSEKSERLNELLTGMGQGYAHQVDKSGLEKVAVSFLSGVSDGMAGDHLTPDDIDALAEKVLHNDRKLEGVRTSMSKNLALSGVEPQEAIAIANILLLERADISGLPGLEQMSRRLEAHSIKDGAGMIERLRAELDEQVGPTLILSKLEKGEAEVEKTVMRRKGFAARSRSRGSSSRGSSFRKSNSNSGSANKAAETASHSGVRTSLLNWATMNAARGADSVQKEIVVEDPSKPQDCVKTIDPFASAEKDCENNESDFTNPK